MYVPISGCKCASVCQKFLMPRRVQPCRRLGSARLCSALTLSRLLMFSQRFVLATKSPRSCCLWLQASLRLCAAETEPLANTNSARATRHVKTEGKNNRKKHKKNPRPSSHVEALCTHVCKHLKSFSGGLSTSPHSEPEFTLTRPAGVGSPPPLVSEVELSHWDGGHAVVVWFCQKCWREAARCGAPAQRARGETARAEPSPACFSAVSIFEILAG